MNYRPEVDGLRAVAVIPVILFHAGFSIFSGGYIGVDVFFVISGYLITSIIVSEVHEGTFTLAKFYERRARRILPSLFLVMAASSMAGWWLLSPAHMEGFSRSLIAVSTFASNILFWQESGYWGTDNELKPLLHTWSLGVEEQYYFVFPILLIFVSRFGAAVLKTVVFALVVLSLAVSELLLVSHHASASFFLLPSRFWELGLGALSAILLLDVQFLKRLQRFSEMQRDVIGAIGLTLIFLSVFFLDESSRFPGVTAAPSVVGTVLVIVFVSRGTLTGSLLSSKIPVSLGLASYSAYLWHQPLFAFSRHFSVARPSTIVMLTLIALTILLAHLSLRYVEAPFRNKQKVSRKSIYLLSFTGSVSLFAFGIGGYISDGFADIRGLGGVQHLEGARERIVLPKICSNKSVGDGGPGLCVLKESSGKQAVLFGDSHARSLAEQASSQFGELDVGLQLIQKPACPPVLEVYRADQTDPLSCVDHNRRSYAYLIENEDIEYVILTARWSLGLAGQRFDNQEGGVERGSKPHLDLMDGDELLYHREYDHVNELKLAYTKSINLLVEAGKTVILIYPVPEAGWNVPDYLIRSLYLDRGALENPLLGSTSFKVFTDRNSDAIDALDDVVGYGNVIRIKPAKLFCNIDSSERCITHLDGSSLFRDDDHLSDLGAAIVVKEIVSRIPVH